MTLNLSDKLVKWKSLLDDPEISLDAITLVEFLSNRVFSEYEPSEVKAFPSRLNDWLNNLDDEISQKRLLSIIPHIFYVGRSEFNSLFRTAYKDNISRWLIDECSIDLLGTDYFAELTKARENTWLCPLTDSLRINSFLKINNSNGHDLRPDWRALARIGSKEKISAYMRDERIERVVLLEDFIGSGIQSEATVKFAVDNFPDIQFLLCPLIICPSGNSRFASLANARGNLSYDPVLALDENCFLTAHKEPNEPRVFDKIRMLHSDIAKKIGVSENDLFGFDSTGAMTVMYSNCPDNSLLMLRADTPNWKPLFNRVRRPE
jgi:hypothetical protein